MRGAWQRARREGTRCGNGKLLAVLHTIGQSAAPHGSRSGFTGTQSGGRCEGRPGASGEVGDDGADARRRWAVWRM